MNISRLVELGLVEPCTQCRGNYTSYPPPTRQLCPWCHRGWNATEGGMLGYFCVWSEKASMTDDCAVARKHDNLPWHESCGPAYVTKIEHG